MSKRKNIHLVMQGKGGCGKTFIAWLLSQYYAEKIKDLRIIDTDNVNGSLLKFKSLHAAKIDLLSKDERSIEVGRLDSLFDYIAAAPSDVVIDTGSSEHVQLDAFLTKERVDEVLYEINCNLIVHAPVTGGENKEEMLDRLAHMLDAIKNSSFVVWLNPYFGEIFNENAEAVTEDQKVITCFEDLDLYEKFNDKIKALITIPTFPEDTKGKVLRFVLDNLYTFKDFDGLSLNSLFDTPQGQFQLTLLQRMRRKMIQEELWNAMSPLESLEILKDNPPEFIERKPEPVKQKSTKKSKTE